MAEDTHFFRVADHEVLQVVPADAAEPSRRRAAAPPPRDLRWHLELCGVDRARATWGLTGAGARVAVIDTGVNAAHPRLGGRAVAHDYTVTRDGPADADGHGSHCCGIVHDVAPGAEVHSFRVFDDELRADRRSLVNALAAIRDGTHGRFDVVNMSLGSGQPDQAMRILLLEICASGTLVCCAAGNSEAHDRDDAPRFGTVDWPAHYNSTIAVGSVDRRRRRSPFSSSGPKITVMAPGQEVWSCWKDDSMACLSGTSMASPFAAGVLALAAEMCAARGWAAPSLSEALCCMAKSCAGMEAPGFDFFTGYGCLDPRGFLGELARLRGG